MSNCSPGGSSPTTLLEEKLAYDLRRKNSSESLSLQWRDNPKSQNNPSSPHFNVKHRELYWIHARFHPCWVVQEALRGRGLHPNIDYVEHGELCMGTAEKKAIEPCAEKMEITMQRVMGSCHKTQEEEGMSIVRVDGNQQMSQEDTLVAVTYVAALKACAKQKDLQRGSTVHTGIEQSGLLEKNEFVGSALVSMYAKCGALEKAQEVFNQLSLRTVVAWNSLITGYAQHGLGKEALDCFERMQLEGFSPDAVTFACILKACSSIENLRKGKQIHAQIAREHLLEEDIVIVSALVVMYAKCGALEKAQEVFDEFPVRDLVSWNALIAGYVQRGYDKEALNCFEHMQLGGFSPDAATFACILKACGSIGDLNKGQEIHAQIMRERMLEKQNVVSIALLDMYAKCGALGKAQEVFDELLVHDTVAWNVLIAGHAQHGYGEEALNCCKQMELGGLSPDAPIFASILKACSSIGAFDKGEKIHAQILREGLLEKDVVVANALIDMYAKSNSLERAQKVFDELSVRNVVSWTALIAGYAQHGHSEKALDCYKRMQLGGFSPDAITFICILKACGNIGDSKKGGEIHAQVLQERFLGKHITVSNAVIDMYAKCGVLDKAQEVFDELSVRDAVSWTALIAGYAQHELGEKALECFKWMQVEGFSPDAVTFTWVLRACGSMGAAYKGQKVHAEIVKYGFMEKGTIQSTVLVAMYADCSMFAEAQELFDKLPTQDVVSWSALMAGYAQLGMDEIVFNLFDKMIGEAIEPNTATFTVVLSTCSHRGLLDEGEIYFKLLSETNHVIPSLEHLTCMVDLFGRAGLLDETIAVIEVMPHSPNCWMWHTILAACQTWGNMNLGRWAFQHAVQLDENDIAAYISMSIIYATAGRLKGVDKMRASEW